MCMKESVCTSINRHLPNQPTLTHPTQIILIIVQKFVLGEDISTFITNRVFTFQGLYWWLVCLTYMWRSCTSWARACSVLECCLLHFIAFGTCISVIGWPAWKQTNSSLLLSLLAHSWFRTCGTGSVSAGPGAWCVAWSLGLYLSLLHACCLCNLPHPQYQVCVLGTSWM